MAAIKRAMFDQDSFAVMATLKDRDRYMDMAFELQAALTAIKDLDPADVNEYCEEWREAECFHQARQIARNALNALKKESNDGSV